MDRNFSRSLDAVFEYEGGYSNNPKDKGGPTNMGVTLRTFRAFIKPNGTIADLKALTRDQAAIVYRRQYWDKVLGAELPDGVDHCVMDFAVNSGDDRAERMAQTIAGATVDGQIGPKTLDAIRAMDPDTFIDRYCDKRLEFLHAIPGDTFDGGWEKRVAKVRALAHQLAQQPPLATRIEVKQVPVAPPAPKRKFNWPMGAIGLASPSVGAFFTQDFATKALLLGVGAAAVVFFLWQGEFLIGRTKKLLASFQ